MTTSGGCDAAAFNASVPLTRLDTGETYLFSVSSKGGLRCINGLTRTYGSRVKAMGEKLAALQKTPRTRP